MINMSFCTKTCSDHNDWYLRFKEFKRQDKRFSFNLNWKQPLTMSHKVKTKREARHSPWHVFLPWNKPCVLQSLWALSRSIETTDRQNLISMDPRYLNIHFVGEDVERKPATVQKRWLSFHATRKTSFYHKKINIFSKSPTQNISGELPHSRSTITYCVSTHI